ncbi:MAG: hypothetical protein OXE43_13085 [Chloroflexi bacterium]|nr:hypothetical protein [Chloroflexota bacterium]
MSPTRAGVKPPRRKPGAAAHDPAYLFTERRVGYRMAAGETPPLAEEPFGETLDDADGAG